MALEAELAALREELSSRSDEARAALELTHRQYRRDLVPVTSSLALVLARETEVALMALDPQHWTVKTREAFQAATTQAAAAGNPYVTPAHLLLALLNQPEGIARPLLVAAGLDPVTIAASLNEKVAREPRDRRRIPAGTLARSAPGPRRGRRAARKTSAMSTCRSTTCWSPLRASSARPKRCFSQALRGIRGSARDHLGEPRRDLSSRSRNTAATSRRSRARASSTPSSAATTRSAASSRSSRDARRTTPS